MPLYGGPPKKCPFCVIGEIITTDKLYAGMIHTFECTANPAEHHGYYSNNKDETENISSDEKLIDAEMHRLIALALIGRTHFNTAYDDELIAKILKWNKSEH